MATRRALHEGHRPNMNRIKLLSILQVLLEFWHFQDVALGSWLEVVPGNLLQFLKYETMGAVWFLTSKKVHGQTNQSLQFSVPHDSQAADSLAWYPGESPSSRGNKSGHRISPPWTYMGKEVAVAWKQKQKKTTETYYWLKIKLETFMIQHFWLIKPNQTVNSNSPYCGRALGVKSSTSL